MDNKPIENIPQTSSSETSVNRTFYKVIVFCSNPIVGKYKFSDQFQIYPLVSEHAPKSEQIKYYPIVLEFYLEAAKAGAVPKGLEDVADFVTLLTRSQNKQKKILNALSVISNYRFFLPKVYPQWFINTDLEKKTEEEINNQTSQVGMNVFSYPQWNSERVISGFSTVSFPDIELITHQEYYSTFGLDGIETVKFPYHIDQTLHYYYSLEGEMATVINSAILQIVNGIDIRDEMKSLAFISFISSIETMVNYENKDVEIEKCKECGQLKFQVTAKFRNYISKYGVDNPSAKKQINEIYNLRSKMVHTGLLMLNDGTIDWGNEEEITEEWHTLISVMHLSRLTLVNWMLLNHDKIFPIKK